MKHIALILSIALIASVALGGYCNLTSQVYQEKKPEKVGPINNPDLEALSKYGWRTVELSPVPADKHLVSRSFTETDKYTAKDNLVLVDRATWEKQQADFQAKAASNAVIRMKNPFILTDVVTSNQYTLVVSNGVLKTNPFGGYIAITAEEK